MSLRIRLICLIALVLVLSLAVEGTIVSFNASRSVPTEMNSALQVGQQIVKSALAGLPESPDPRRSLEDLVASFKGNRHLRVSLTGDAGASVEPSLASSHFGAVPPWFVRLLGISPVVDRVPVAIAGQDYGSVVIETDPTNEILEVWNDLGDSLIVLSLFFGLNILLNLCLHRPCLAAVGSSCRGAQTNRPRGLQDEDRRHLGTGIGTASA